jgi:lysophospholipase
VLILYTGGTIGMKKGARGYEPVSDFLAAFVRGNPQLHDPAHGQTTDLPFVLPPFRPETRVAYRIVEYAPLLDSSNIGMKDWRRIASDIKGGYDAYDAFIVLHGTDTMAFTASALSFMLENLAKTVILTGSQIPISQVRNDGIDNLLGALLIAGHYDIPEVCLYFANKLLRGNRSVKLDASALDAFQSGNFPPLVEMGTDIKVAWPSVLTPPGSAPFSIHTQLEPNVAALRLFPGMTSRLIHNVTQPPLSGLVLQTYGTGNAPDADQDFLDALKAASDRGVVIVNCTQCFRGMVEGHYAAGQKLTEAGVVSGADMTVEAALTKLAYLFGRGYEADEVKRRISEDLRGELTPPAGVERFSVWE